MRKIALALAAASAAIAVPAHANEGRVEARGGVTWSQGSSEAIAGVAAGYDFISGSDGTGGFLGAEATADKILADNTRITVGANLRGGVVVEGGGKLYAVGGYQSKPCQACEDAWSVGGGFEVPFGEKLYGKLEYRHFFANNAAPNFEAAVVGVGFRF